MIPNLGDIVHNGWQHWIIYDRIDYPQSVVQYKILVLETGDFTTYTAPFSGDLEKGFRFIA